MHITRFAPAFLAVTLVMGCTSPRSSGERAEAAQGSPTRQATAESAHEVIGSRAELEAYLAAHETTPLDALSPPAKERFLGSLRFGDEGLMTFSGADLESQLTEEEGRRILRLFGAESYAGSVYPEGHVPEPRYERENDFERRHVALREAQKALEPSASAEERALKMEQAFARLFPDPAESTVSRAEERDLRAHLKALALMGTYRQGQVGAGEAFQLFQALEEARAVLPSDAARVQTMLIAARRFEDAAALAKRYPNLSAVPEFRRLTVPADRSLWAVEEGPRLVQQPPKDITGTQLIVIASPICSPTIRLATAALEDEELHRILSRATWLVPAFGSVLAEPVLDWNQRFDWAPLALVHDEAEWPEIRTWWTPTFYFVKDGQVLETVSGWIPEKSRPELMSAAERVGLLDDSSEEIRAVR
jgi:hypothetical protein